MLARAAMPAPGSVADPVPAARALLPRPRVTIRRRFGRDPAVALDPARLFMRRARHELGAAAHEALVRALRDFKANGDAAAVLRVATRARAEDDPERERAVRDVRGVGAGDAQARARRNTWTRARGKRREKKKARARRKRKSAVKNGAGPATTLGALDRDPSRVSRKRARSSPSSSLSRDPPASSLTRDGERRLARRSNLRPPSRWRARLPGACCAATRAASPSRRCGHPACYACWLAHIAGRTGTGPGGAGRRARAQAATSRSSRGSSRRCSSRRH